MERFVNPNDFKNRCAKDKLALRREVATLEAANKRLQEKVDLCLSMSPELEELDA